MAAGPEKRRHTFAQVLAAGELAEDKRKKVEELIEEEEGATNRLGGWLGKAVVGFAVVVSSIHLYAAVAGSPPFTGSPIIPTYTLRPLHVGLVLALIYVLFPFARGMRNRVTPIDWLCAGRSLAMLGYILYQGPEFGDRAIDPEPLDFYIGVVLIVLLLEATRRSTGWIMPVVSLCFIAYALLGRYLPPPWTHRGYTIERLTGHLYMTLEGIFGTTVDVSSSLIILFTIFGAVLQYSGAGKFFIDFSFAAMGGKRNAAGRSVVLSSFLLGGPSGSGVATTVTIGTVAYPLLEKAGYEKNAAGGLLAAGGLGAIISPPVLGAAAFLIAEFLKISYLDVIWMAAVPTILYYFSILVMVELDAAKYGGGGALLVETGTLWRLTAGYWFHFGSLDLDHHSDALRLLARALRILGDDAGDRRQLPAARYGTGAGQARACAIGRHHGSAQHRRHLCDRRHHRRRDHAHRPGAALCRHHHRLCPRQSGPDRAVLGGNRVDSRPRRTCDGVLHHVRGDCRACAHQARRAGLRRAYVHLLLRGAFGSIAAYRAIAIRRRGDHRRQSLPHDLAGLEVHHARIPRAVRIRVRSARRRLAAQGAARRQLGRRRQGHFRNPGGHCYSGLRLSGPVPAPKLVLETVLFTMAECCWCFPS